MIINEHKVVALVREDIVVVHRRHIHLVVDRMVVEMAMVRIWDYHHHQLVCSIQHLVSFNLSNSKFVVIISFCLVGFRQRQNIYFIFFFRYIHAASAFAPLVATSTAWHQALVPVHASPHQTSWHNPSAATAV